MNKARRKWLQDVINTIEEKKDELISIAEEEHEAYDNLPEGIQESEMGDTMYENADDLEQASSDLEDIIDTLNDIISR